VICNISPWLSIAWFVPGSAESGGRMTRCGLPLPVYILADEKHSAVSPTGCICQPSPVGRVIWHLGYSESQSAAALTESYGVFQRAALKHKPSYAFRAPLTDGLTAPPGACAPCFQGLAGLWPRHALNKLPSKLIGLSAPVRMGLRSPVPYPALPLSPAKKLTGGGAWPTATPLCRSHRDRCGTRAR